MNKAHLILKNNNICLRPVEPDDADFMWVVESDSSEWIQNSLVAPFSRELLYNYACNYDANPYSAGQLRLIIENNDKCRIGIADLYELSAQHHTAFVGIYILPEFRRYGFAQNALALLEDYSLKLLNLRQLGAKIVEGNDISLSLFTKRGYNVSGKMKDWIQSGEDTYSVHILQKSLRTTP